MKFTLSGIEPEICDSTTIRVMFAIRSDLLFAKEYQAWWMYLLYNDFPLLSRVSNEFPLFCMLAQKEVDDFMYTAQMLKDRIKSTCKAKNIGMEKMVLDCGLGINAIRQISDTKGMASFALASIADYLDVSVDYLLGRTDVPEVNR